MRRREFIVLMSGAAVVWPLATLAQQLSKLPTIGYLGVTTPLSTPQRTAAFVERLRDLGWIEGRTIAIGYRWAEGRTERSAEIAAEFVRLKVDVIVTSGVPAVAAAKQATSIIPIVFAVVADPVGTGLVASLARPGTNVTGFSNQSSDLAGKRLELLREIKPDLRHVAILANAGNPDSARETDEFKTAAHSLGTEVLIAEVRRAQDIVPAFDTFKDRVEALYVVADPLINTNRQRIHTLAMGARIPAIYNAREFVEAGGLVSYGPDFLDMFRRAAEYVDKILHGAKPADLPVQQPTKFELVINLTTAKALGLTVPQALIERADEVIE